MNHRAEAEEELVGSPPPFLLVSLLLGAAVASRFSAIAIAPCENDEAVFAGAVTRFNLLELSPQAPGFPLWILLGKTFTPILGSPFHALAIVSTVLSAFALPALYIWGRSLVGSWAALGGVLFSAALPVVWVNGGRALADSPGTALIVCGLAALTFVAEGEGEPGLRRWQRVLIASAAGLLAAAGAGVRPHLVTVFGPLLLLAVVRLARVAGRTALAFVLSGLAGTAAWGGWLFVQAGGLHGLRSAFLERADFRSTAIATSRAGALSDSFLVRAFVTPERAALVLGLALVGLVFLCLRRRRGAAELIVFLVPAFLSLWFLHGRTVSRYSVPFVFGVALLAAYGIEALVRWRPLGLVLVLLAAGGFGWEGRHTVRSSALVVPPPMAAIDALEQYVFAGRETVIADDVFDKFLRTERWQGRFSGWPYTDTEFVARPLSTNRRIVRLTDFTGEPDDPWKRDPGWRVWKRGGRVLESLHLPRLHVVGIRDPAPPVFGVGFGAKERWRGRPSYRWSGPAAHLVVPGLAGPPVALLAGNRTSEGGPTNLTVREASTGRLVMSRRVEPGDFELAIADTPVFGPLERPQEYVLSCDRPYPLPPLPGGTRPVEGCFIFMEATQSVQPDELWERLGAEYRVDVGTLRDNRAALEGFHDRESDPSTGVDFRWTTGEASALWVPLPSFVPRLVAIRGTAPTSEPVDVTVSVAGIPVGTIRFDEEGYAEKRVALTQAAVERLSGTAPVRIGLSSRTISPKSLGKGNDERELGIAVDRIILRTDGGA